MILSAIPPVLAGMILACLLVAIATDLASRIIPNRVVLVVLCCSIGLRLVSGPATLLASLLSAIAVLVSLGLLANYDLLGWGDVKLIAAVTFSVPAHGVVPLLFAITMAGGVLSCLYLFFRFVLQCVTPMPSHAEAERGRTCSIRQLVRREGTRILANEPMPYSVAILGGVVYSLATR